MRTAWRWCAAAGIVAFTCSSLFAHIPGLIACGPTGGLEPIIAFELARTTADIASLFGAEPCTSTLVAAQKTGLLLDGLGFIPSYTAFLILGAIAAGARGRARQVAIILFLGAALSDEIEGFLLNGILDHLPGTPALLNALWWAVHMKFGLLALGTIQIGAILSDRPWQCRVVAGALIVGGGNAFAWLVAKSPAWMMQGFLVAWVALLAVALISSFWPRVFSTDS
jgi:hypothetical protein